MPLTIEDLKPDDGAKTTSKRLGRGHGSGRGKTAGRGTKGQKSRSGRGVRLGFEGGQNPLQQRMPYKPGFTNIWRAQWEIVKLERLASLDVDGPITPQVLADAGLIRSTDYPVKILAGGELSKPLTVRAQAISKSALAEIERAGGSFEQLERTDRWTQAAPRSRRLPLNRELKAMRVGKVGGPKRREAIELLKQRENGTASADGNATATSTGSAAAASAAPAATQSAAPPAEHEAPAGVEGTDWVRAAASGQVPAGFPIKGNASSRLYHPAGTRFYTRTDAEFYFATPEAAEAAGDQLPPALRQTGELAANEAGEAIDAAVNDVDAETEE
jgi:large subunit ribosomal protein L15